jgi:hypothetical protein
MRHIAGREPPMGEKVKVALAWMVVLIPAVWGVGQVVTKSAALFK